jgi:hypothetical protein
MRIVTAITQTNPAVVTTSFAHQYNSGIIVRLDIPLANGMQQIVGTPALPVTYAITVLSPTTFSCPVNATSFQAFVNNECAMVLPVGEVTLHIKDATRNVLPYPAT